MVDSDVSSEPLMRTSDSVIPNIVLLQPVEVPSKLCYILEDNNITPLPGLVVTSDDIFTPDSKSWIKVQYIRTGDTKECLRDNVKLLESKDIMDNKINQKEVVDELIQLDTSNPLNLAMQQKALSLHMQMPLLEDKLIHYTAKNGTVECLTYLINAYPYFPYDAVSENGNTILHSAVQGGIKELIYVILDMAGNSDSIADRDSKLDQFLNATNSDGNTALHLCMIHKKREPIRSLLRAGVKLKVVDAKNNTLLHLAAERDEIDYIKRIINYHLSDTDDQVKALVELKESLLLQNENKKIPVLLPNDRAVVDLILKYSQLDAIVDKEIGSLIHKAAAEDNVLLAQALVEKNIELQVVNSKGFSPLKIASKRGNIGVVKVLLTAGADANYIGKKVPGFSALNNAVQFGQLGCAKLLIDFGANLVHRDMTNTALHSASYGGHPDVVEFLIRDVGMDVNQRNNANRTPLYQSITQGHYSVAKVLLGLGADPNVALNYENETLVHIAVREGEKEILTLLLEAKARPDEALRNGITPLMLAVQADLDDYIPLIMAYGITLAKKDQEGETILHHIARNDSSASAKYILKRIGAMKGITQEFQIFKNKNEHGKTAYDTAIECHSEKVLKIFIRHSPKNYFRNNTQQIHRFYDQKLYDTLKEIFSGLVTVDVENGSVTAEVIIFESNEDGNFTDNQSEYPIKQTLLHKLKDCPDPDLKYHPLVNLIIEDKLRFHHWRYLTSLISFLFFLFCLNYALIQASTKCDLKLWAYETSEDAGRAFCEIVCLIYFAFFSVFLFVEFFTTWNFVFSKKSGKRYGDPINIRYLNGKQYNFLSTTIALITSQYRILDLKLKFFLSAVHEYFNAKFIFIDLIALESFGLLVILRISGSPAQWSFAGLTYIFFSLSLLKHTRLVPKLGAYVNDILQVFYKDIPSFSIVLIIIILAFSGGIHLAARQQSLFVQLQQNQSIDILNNLPYPMCNGSQTAFFWFNPSLTALYDLRRPLLAGLVLFLDRGVGMHEEDLLQDNFIFTLIYLAFAYLITILMLNILIAQFVNSYRRIANVNSYDYKFELLVGLELRSFILFGKFFRKSSSIEIIEMPPSVLDQIQREATTRPSLEKAIMDINTEFIRRGTEIEQEFDKNSKSHDNLRSKVSELSREVNSRFVEFGKGIDTMGDLKECLKEINELKGSMLEIKEMLKK